MKRTFICLAVLCVTLLYPYLCLADDIDMYDISTVKPNVLIIFDNSGSMGSDYPYDNDIEYCSGAGCYVTDTIYQKVCLRWGKNSCRQWSTTWSVYTGTFTDSNHDGIDDSDTNIRRGNRLNFDTGDYDNRLAVAKIAIKTIIDETKSYVRFGLMVLNGAKDINQYGVTFSQYHNDNTVLSTTYGADVVKDRTDAEITTLKGYIDGMTANSGTPLANRLIQAAKYFRGVLSKPSGGYYTSPIDVNNWCQKNFVMIITDGQPEGEGNSLTANNNGDYDDIEDFMDTNAHCRDCDSDGRDPDSTNRYVNGGSDYLDDIAKYLHDTNDSLDPSHVVSGNQNLTIYTIGFKVADQLLQDTATNGGGSYHTTDAYDELIHALETVMADIIEQTQTFTAPVVPVQRTTSGNKMYISLFTPKSSDRFWPGYLMKLHIGTDGHLYGNDETTLATDAQDNLLESLWISSGPAPRPYWEVHAVLKNMNLDSRNIYTYLGSSAHLNNSSNTFVTSNASITSTMLGTPTKSSDADPATTPRDDLMRYIRGYDSYDQDIDGGYTDKRENIFGDILHSKPIIIDYSSSVRVIYVGTNDGMLHAIDDADGSEKWAFIPPDLLPKLKNMVQGVGGHQYYVDSSPKAYILDNDEDGVIETPDELGRYDKVVIIFGERGGGTSYCALDITNPNDPQYLWRIDNANAAVTGIPNPTTVISELGESWSEPEIGHVKAGTVGSETDTAAAFIGGGFSSDNTKGRGVFIINALTGALIKHYTIADSGTYSVLSNMTTCIPSSVLAADTTFDGYINRVYVGDTAGRMWRFGLHKTSSSDTRAENGNINNWTPRFLFQSNSGTKIYYPPDLALETGYAYLYFGTGDRDEPMCVPSPDAHINRFYAVKDKNLASDVFTTLTEGNLVNVTDDLLQDPGTSETTKSSIRTQLLTGNGWYIIMEHDGEKVLAAPVAIYSQVIYTTFTPSTSTCSYGGDARMYAVNYLSGEAVWNLDTTNEGLQKTDRTKVIGYGIPTEPVVVIGADGRVRVYIAVGGKIIFIDPTGGPVGLTINSWRELF